MTATVISVALQVASPPSTVLDTSTGRTVEPDSVCALIKRPIVFLRSP